MHIRSWPLGLVSLVACNECAMPSAGAKESSRAATPRDLAEWILANRLDVRLQLQLHKLLRGDEAGR